MANARSTASSRERGPVYVDETEPIVGLIVGNVVGLVVDVVMHTEVGFETTGGAEVVVEVEEVRIHSLIRSSLLMRSTSSWVDWNMDMVKVERNEMEMSATVEEITRD